MNDSITRAEFDKAVDKVLSQPGYAHLKGSVQDFIASAKEAIGNWLREILEKAFSNLSVSSSIPKSMATVFLVIGLIGFLAIVVFVAVKATKTFSRRPALKEILGEKITAGTTTDSLREKAAGYRISGEYRLAVRYEYIALLLFLHERNVLYLDESNTNEEITGYLEKNKFGPISVFRNIVQTFNASWYGYKPPQDTIFAQWRNDVTLIWNKVNDIEKKSK